MHGFLNSKGYRLTIIIAVASILLLAAIPVAYSQSYTDAFLSCGKSSVVDALSDPRRFIAHAGGAYRGHFYTNSLEALENSYANGYKLIELDFIKTSDSEIVAAHHWEHWKKITGSEKNRPNLDEFLNTPIHENLTPMDFGTVNKWFSVHKDAILVTDKTRDFDFFAENFVDPDRLIVEVFSINEFKRAKSAGIKYPMLNLASAYHKSSSKTFSFIRHRVRIIAVGSRQIEVNKKLLTRLNKMNKCIFAFTSNEESFMVNNIGNTIHGVYTDLWDIREASANCNGDNVDCTTY